MSTKMQLEHKIRNQATNCQSGRQNKIAVTWLQPTRQLPVNLRPHNRRATLFAVTHHVTINKTISRTVSYVSIQK